MTGDTDFASVPFPWVPTWRHIVPSPAWVLKDDVEPPKLLMVTLRLLADGARPKDLTPRAWLKEIDFDSPNVPIRAFARDCFGLHDVWNEERETDDWFDVAAKTSDGAARRMSLKRVKQRCWTGYAKLLLDDLAAHGETLDVALERVPREWRQWRSAQAAEFRAKWEDADAWPPALALSRIMFEGDWSRIAAFLENGRSMPTDAMFLESIGLFAEGEKFAVRLRASRALKQAMRRRADHPKRVIMSGLLNGTGVMAVIPPSELASLEWAYDQPQGFGAVLERRGGVFYSNVMVDAASVVDAFPSETTQVSAGSAQSANVPALSDGDQPASAALQHAPRESVPKNRVESKGNNPTIAEIMVPVSKHCDAVPEDKKIYLVDALKAAEDAGYHVGSKRKDRVVELIRKKHGSRVNNAGRRPKQ